MQLRKWGYFLLGLICVWNSLTVEQMYAINSVEDKVIDLGRISEYEVKTDEVQFITREYAKAEQFNKGDVIDLPGTYIVRLKEADKVIKFEIPERVDLVVSNDEEFMEVLRYTLGQMHDKITFRFSKAYGKEVTNTKKKLSQVLNDTLFKYPLLLYGGGMYSRDGDKITLTFDYPMSREEGLKAQLQIEERLMQDIENRDLTKSDIELQKEIIYDILDYVEYNDYSANVKDIPLSHHVQGLVVEGNKVVCDGYGRIFMLMANTLGIPTEIIRGVGGGTNHAWNIVTHNNQTYHVDLTWADEDSYRVGSYVNYVNEMDSYMEQTHSWDREKYPKCEDTEYLNTKIYDFISLEDLKDGKGLDFEHSFKVDSEVEDIGKQIANAYGDIIEYYTVEKYGQKIITVINEKGE